LAKSALGEVQMKATADAWFGINTGASLFTAFALLQA
jgi:hypothetical protein